MNRIISIKNLHEKLIRLEISTPVARKDIEAGQYIVIRSTIDEPSVALPVIRCNPDKGTVLVIYSPVDEISKAITLFTVGSVLHTVEGPYGLPLQMPCSKTVLCVGDENGLAVLLAGINSLRKAGNRIVILLKANASGIQLPEEVISAYAHEMIILPNEGNLGQKRTLEQAVAQVLNNHAIQEVFVAGSSRTICETYKVSINHPVVTQALMVNSAAGKSVHGIFRVSISGSARSVCVDSHDFNAYYANFDEMARRFEPGKSLQVKATTAV